MSSIFNYSEGFDKALKAPISKKLKLKRAKAKLISIKLKGSIEKEIPAVSYPEAEVEGEELVVKYRLKARKLARSILRRWHARLDLQEVDSIVDLSLCEASLRFNPTKGASFMTFMYYHLRGNLIRAVSTAASQNTIPFSSCESLNRGANSGDAESAGSFRNANALEIAEALSSQEVILPDEALLKKELLSISTKACSQLDPLEREIIERIYLHEQQLMDIAHMLGYSRCHVSRVKRKALEVLNSEMSKTLGMEIPAPLADEDSKSDRRVLRRRPRGKGARRASQELVAKAA